MRLNEYASTRRTRGSYKIPTSVQKSIPIDEIYADGTWRSGEVYSQMWSVSDINYAMQSDDKKQDILAKMGRIYSNIPTDCWAQLCIVSQRMDEISFERDVLYHRANDGLDAYRVERNRLMKAYAKEIGNVKQQKYLILSTNKQNSKDARERLNQVQRNMLGELSNIGCKVCALDNNARLEVLHNFFRIGEETHFQFDFDNCTRLGQDFRDAIAPDAMRFCKDHIEINDSYATGITQNAQDCLTNDTACAVLSNSEFVVMLRQTKDILPLRKLYGLSEPQQEYLKLATAGQGILKMGNNIIPFENKQPTTGKVYKLISTKPGEVE